MDLSRLGSELKRRRVFRALVGYGIAAFCVLQIAEPIMHALIILGIGALAAAPGLGWYSLWRAAPSGSAPDRRSVAVLPFASEPRFRKLAGL